MLRLNQLKRLATAMIGTSLAAMALGAVTAASAQAEAGGPVWIVLKGEELKILGAGEKEALTGTGGVTILEAPGVNVECETTKSTGEIIGGNPGTDLASITFEKCHVQGKATCVATSAGQSSGNVFVEVRTMLVEPHLENPEEPASDNEAYEAFFPDNGSTESNLFVEFTLTGGVSPCGLLNNTKVDVNATGSLVEDPSSINKKCGILSLVGTLVSGVFQKTIAGEEFEVGAVDALGATGPTEGWWWMPVEKKWLLLVCKLEALTGEAFQNGIADLTLVSKNPYGWALP